MSTINIAGSIKELMIYDDPEFCCSDTGEECSLLGYRRWSPFYEPLCFAFNRKLSPKNQGDVKLVKIHECKEFWKKAKEKQCDCEPFQSCEKCAR